MRFFYAFFFFIFLVSHIFPQGRIDPTHHVPIDKNLSGEWESNLWDNTPKVYQGNELKTIGMPCGGIAAGQLYVRGDGTLANWWIANNAYNTGYGIDYLMNFETNLGPWKVCYQTFEPFSYIDQGFSISFSKNGKTITKALSKKDFDNISFVGEYPIAKINYESNRDPLPVLVNVEVFSPFIPLNARESATPGTILKYTLKNTLDETLEVKLNGWLQNPVCLDIKDEILADSRNQIISQEGMTTLYMDLTEVDHTPESPKINMTIFDDFERGDYKGWTISGTAMGKTPTKDNPVDMEIDGYLGDYLVNSKINGDEATGKLVSKVFTITDAYILFKIGGGLHPGKTCVNLVVDGNIVRTETGRNEEQLKDRSWDVSNLKGKQAQFEIVDEWTSDWGHINLDQIVFSNVANLNEKYFPENKYCFGNMAFSVLSENAEGDADLLMPGVSEVAQKGVGAVLTGQLGESLTLNPGESKSIVFLLTWYFPNRPMNYGEGNNWDYPIPTDGPAIGNMYANWFDNSMDVAVYLKDNLERLSDQTHAFHKAYYVDTSLPYWLKQRLMMPASTLATETCQWWATDKFWAWEGVGSCVGTCTHVWNYEQALAHLFPELERNIRERTDFSTSFQRDGSILARNGWGDVLIDGHAGTILKAYREHLLSKDNLFLSRNWDKIKVATQFLIREDGNADGLIEKSQANTYDIAFHGANTYVGGLYLAALKSASAMAGIVGDTAFSSECKAIYYKGEQLTMQKLWNGEYFIQDVDLVKYPENQYADGCLSDQLFGQTWAHLVGLGYIYPEVQTKKALQSIWKYNWAKDICVQTKYHKPERVFADAGDPGLLVCTWPKSTHPGEAGVRYRDEVWTGIEYQVATNMIYENMINEGLSVVKGIHERYSPEKHNPWNEIECGDHYARAMASWGVLIALEDYFYNGPEKSLRFAPKVQKDQFNGFYTAAEGWGNISQKRTALLQQNDISVAYGKLRLKSFDVELMFSPKEVKLYHGKIEIPVVTDYHNQKLSLKFKEVCIMPGDTLILKVIY